MLPLRNHKRRTARDGFAVAAVLYTLAMAGVLTGVLFSSVGQGLKGTAQAANALADAGQIKNALNLLAASGSIGSDGLTYCPPRSSHPSGNCAGASEILIRLSDVSAGDLHLPQDAASVASGGSPYEVAIFAPGAGVPQTDARGRYWIVCRWENQLSAPSAPAFVVLGAGPSGKMQSKCGDVVGTNENLLTFLSVGAASHQSSAWNLDGTSAKFGALGSQVSVDASGNLTAGAGNFTSLTDSGALSVSGLSTLTGGATVGGTLTAGTSTLGAVSASSLGLSGALTGTAGSFTSLTDSGNLIVLGSVGIGTTSPTYALKVYQTGTTDLTLGAQNVGTGATYLRTDAAGNYSAYLSNGANAMWAIGQGGGTNFKVKDLTDGTAPFMIEKAAPSNSLYVNASGNVGIGTASPTTTLDVKGTLTAGTSTLGAVSASSLGLSGALTGTSATFSGNVQAATFSGGGVSLTGGGITATGAASSFGAVSVSSLTDSGALSVSGLSTLTGGATIGGTLTAGTSTLGAVSASSVTSSGTITGNLFSGSGASLTNLPASSITGTLAVGKGGTGTATAFTQGSVIFAGAGGVYSQDNANFFYDAAQHSLNIGTTVPDGGSSLYIENNGAYNSLQEWAQGIGIDTRNSDTNCPQCEVYGLDIFASRQSSQSRKLYGTIVGGVIGITSYAEAYNPSGTPGAIRWAEGADIQVYNVAAAESVTGITSFSENGGVLSEDQTGIYIDMGSDDGGTVPVQRGLYIDSWGDPGTITNRYSIYIENPSVTVSGSDFGIYQAGATQKNYFAGKVGIGSTTPQATLDVNGTAKLKAQTSAPLTCSSTTKGTIAFASAAGRLCVCNGTSWIFDYNAAACTW